MWNRNQPNRDPESSESACVYEELTTIALFYIIGKYNSDRDVLEHTSTSHIAITLVTHPGVRTTN